MTPAVVCAMRPCSSANAGKLMELIARLEAMLAQGQDSALLRYSLGNEYFKARQFTAAVEHLARAVALDPEYSAAWKLYGKTLAENNQIDEAINAYTRGIHVAELKGDLQAAKEMRIFRKRLKNQ